MRKYAVNAYFSNPWYYLAFPGDYTSWNGNDTYDLSQGFNLSGTLK